MFDLEADRSFGRRWSLSTWIGLFFGLNGPFFRLRDDVFDALRKQTVHSRA